jgi:general secretion pathway protein G
LSEPKKEGKFMKKRFKQTRTSAFTLVEIMVVVIILSILAALIIPEVMGSKDDAKISKAKADVSELENAVERFSLHMDRRPTTEEGLKALTVAPADAEGKWRGPYIKLLQNDPWGNPYQYRNPGSHNTSGVDIWSRGSDGADGGDGTAADVGNWQ